VELKLNMHRFRKMGAMELYRYPDPARPRLSGTDWWHKLRDRLIVGSNEPQDLTPLVQAFMFELTWKLVRLLRDPATAAAGDFSLEMDSH
jgi:hypothetical protein